MKFSAKQVNILLVVLGALATVLALVLEVVLPEALGVTGEEGIEGLEVAFGDKDGILAFSIFGTLAIILPLVGGLLAMFLPKDTFVSAAVFFVAAILLFLLPSFVNLTDEIPAVIQEAMSFKLAIGGILAAVLSAIAGVLSLLKVLKIKISD